MGTGKARIKPSYRLWLESRIGICQENITDAVIRNQLPRQLVLRGECVVFEELLRSGMTLDQLRDWKERIHRHVDYGEKERLLNDGRVMALLEVIEYLEKQDQRSQSFQAAYGSWLMGWE